MDFSLLSKYGIPFAPFKIAKSLPDALSASQEIGFPIVMKAISPQAVHKSNAGGVILGIGNAGEA